MELIDVYELSGKKSGDIKDKKYIHEKGVLHKSICVWIMNEAKEVLMQKRSPAVAFGNLYDVSYAGHISAGELPLDAVIREGKEELGIDIDISKLQYLFSCKEYYSNGTYTENEILEVYLYNDNIKIEDFQFLDNEVSSVEYISLAELSKMSMQKSESIVPYNTLYYFSLKVLKKNDKRKETNGAILYPWGWRDNN